MVASFISNKQYISPLHFPLEKYNHTLLNNGILLIIVTSLSTAITIQEKTHCTKNYNWDIK